SRYVPAFVELRKSALRLQRYIADANAGAVLTALDVVEAERRNHAGGEAVGHAVKKLLQRAVAVHGVGIAIVAVAVVTSARHHVVHVRFDQRMTLRQRRGAGSDDGAGPPGVVERLPVRIGSNAR